MLVRSPCWNIHKLLLFIMTQRPSTQLFPLHTWSQLILSERYNMHMHARTHTHTCSHFAESLNDRHTQDHISHHRREPKLKPINFEDSEIYTWTCVQHFSHGFLLEQSSVPLEQRNQAHLKSVSLVLGEKVFWTLSVLQTDSMKRQPGLPTQVCTTRFLGDWVCFSPQLIYHLSHGSL